MISGKLFQPVNRLTELQTIRPQTTRPQTTRPQAIQQDHHFKDLRKNTIFNIPSGKNTAMSPVRKTNPKLRPEFQEYFWDVDFKQLSVKRHSRFIAERILNYGDPESIKWLLTWADSNFLKELIDTSRNLNARTRNYWKTILRS